MRSVSEKVLEKISTKVLCSTKFYLWKLRRLWDNVEKYDRARQGTHDNIIRRVRIACWITKATYTHSECGIIIALPQQRDYKNAHQCYVITCIACLVSLKWSTGFQAVLLNAPSCGYTTPPTFRHVQHQRSSQPNEC